MKLIADSGSTKTDWACIYEDGKTVLFKSAGYNPNYVTRDYMVNDIETHIPENLDTGEVTDIYFYGAGVTELQFGFIRKTLAEVFTHAKHISVAMDLLGSAHALLGNCSGFAAILGTGTNSCIYDGKRVVKNIDSLGFILGDEGSGGYLGKELIRDYIRGNMPPDIYETVKSYIKMTGDELIDEVYTKPFPNRFCARYAIFIGNNVREGNYFYRLVSDSFRALFKNIISRYENYTLYKFNCVGSIGYYFRNILEPVAEEYGMEMGKVIKSPLDGLIAYYGSSNRNENAK